MTEKCECFNQSQNLFQILCDADATVCDINPSVVTLSSMLN